jgi:peptide deformylase
MAELKIALLGEPILRQKAAEIEAVDEELRALIEDMFETMYRAEGIGLAAPQVGISKRLIVVDLKDEQTERFALINPRVVERGRELEKEEEGCLSIPGVTALVERPRDVIVEGLDAAGNPKRIEASGLLARCLVHEVDHLDGVLFIDHLSSLKRSMLLRKYRSQQEDAPEASAREKPAQRRSG